jgi:hypothetical protein
LDAAAWATPTPGGIARALKRKRIPPTNAAEAVTMARDGPISLPYPKRLAVMLTVIGATPSPNITDDAAKIAMHKPRISFGITIVKRVVPITATAVTNVSDATSIDADKAIG